MKKVFIIFFVFLLMGFVYSNSPNRIQIVGKVKQRFFLGPPNFGETPEMDRKENPFFIYLDKPLVVKNDDDEIVINEMQLIFKASNEKHKFLQDSNYSFLGYVIPAESGHHHSDFIFIVESQ